MNGQQTPIPIPAASAPVVGEAIRVADMTDMWIQFAHGSTTLGALQIQGSIDGANFFDVGAAFAGGTSGTLEVTPKKLTLLRVNKTVDLDAADAALTLGAFNVND